jgi:hypothetical protein
MIGETIGERLEALACHAQEQAADAHYFACVALAAAQWQTACEWQAVARREADRAAGDVTRLQRAPKEYLELEA